jgi:hypothetical protein
MIKKRYINFGVIFQGVTKEEYELRQKYLQDLELVKEKEHQLHKQKDMNNQEHNLKMQQLRQKEDQLMQKMAEIERAKENWYREKDQLLQYDPLNNIVLTFAEEK